MEKYIHLTLRERQWIERLKSKGRSIREIAKFLRRGKSTIQEELKQNSVNGEYVAKKAHHKAYVKRKYSKVQCLKVANDKDLRIYVEKHIKEEQSPEGISGRIKFEDRHIQHASTKAIYKFVYSPYGRQIEKYLYSNCVSKKPGPKHKKPITIDGRVMIDKRPKRVGNRREFGHFEGDFIESGKDGKGSLLVLVERKTRYPFLRYVEDKSTENINRTVAECMRNTHALSITVDNDISFQKHQKLSSLIGADVFFCHPQTPQEKPTVENRNKAIRRDLPKRSDLSKFSLEYIGGVESKLRNKFMKCLNYKTPKEAWDEEIRKIKNKKIPLHGIMSRALEVKLNCPA